MTKDGIAKLDKDTLGHLEALRKSGGARRFAMVCSGGAVVSLVVYKKGSLDKYKNQAREGGTGQFYHGVVIGRGADFTFQLARADKFEKEPTKNLALKTFLDEAGGLKCKPTFEIVDQCGMVLDENDPLVQRFIALQVAALEACDAHPDRAAEINDLCLQIGRQLENDRSDDAVKGIEQLEKLLKSLATPPPKSDQPPSPSEPPKSESIQSEPVQLESTKSETAAEDFKTLYARLEQELVVLAKAGLATGTPWPAALAEAAKLAAAGDYAGALAGSRELSKQLTEAGVARLNESTARVKKLLAQGFQDRAGDVEKIKTWLGFAQERIKTDRPGSALVALKSLNDLLDTASQPSASKESDVIRKGTVAARGKFVTTFWQTRLEQVRAEVGKLREAIALHNPAEPDPGLLTDQIEKSVFEFCGELNEAILGISDASETDDGPIQAALKAVRDYRGRIAADPLIQHLNDAGSDLGVDVEVEGTLLRALEQIESALAS